VIGLQAAGWGAIAASSLVIGAWIALTRPVEKKTLGLVMAFGSGVLLSSVAFELVEAAVDLAGQVPMAIGLGLGATTFYLGDRAIDQMGAAGMGSVAGPTSPESGLAIVLGAALDGIPESVVLGLTFAAGEGIGLAFLVAVFLSNLPEGIAGTAGLLSAGWAGRRIVRLWVIVVAVSALAALLGGSLLSDVGGILHAVILAFAGGAILTMLTDTLIPEAYENAGRSAGLLATLGFGLAFVLSLLD
jgi:zinc transporter, ZIP family